MISLVVCLVAEIVTYFLKMSEVSVRASIKTRFLNADFQDRPAQLNDRRNTIFLSLFTCLRAVNS